MHRSSAGIFVALAASLAVVVGLAGCGGSGTSSNAPAPTLATTAAVPPAAAAVAPPATVVPTPTFADLVVRVRSGVMRIEVGTCDGKGVGTGFLIAPRLVATVEHVVDGAREISLLRDGKLVAHGTVIGEDAARDLALIRTDVPVSGYRFKLAARAPRLAEEVAAIGFPLALPLTVTRGSVSGLGRTVPIGGVQRQRLVQTDAAVNPGNSGGPLMTVGGEVVGLVDLGTSEANGIAFAVSAEVARPLLEAWQVAPQPIAFTTCAGDSQPPAQSQPPAASHTTSDTTPASFPGYAFSIFYPNTWMVEASEVDHGSYIDTTIRSPDGPRYLLRIDETPGVGHPDLYESGRRVIENLRGQRGYREIDLSYTSFKGVNALHWEFNVAEQGVLLHKEDLFFVTDAGDEFAILTQAPESLYAEARAAFDAIRDSFELR